MKINKKILNIPPFLSTAWENVLAIYTKDEDLVISLSDGEMISIPHLTQAQIELIFSTHQNVVEEYANTTADAASTGQFFAKENLLQFGLGSIDVMGAVTQHNPEQMHAPNLPQEILQKFSSIAKVFPPDEADAIPKAEPHCNCMHCQIARAIRGDSPEGTAEEDPTFEESVPQEDFPLEWEIVQTDEKLYTVTRSLDPQEKYTVFLGTPVGCTCGKQGCEHIIAVLKS